MALQCIDTGRLCGLVVFEYCYTTGVRKRVRVKKKETVNTFVLAWYCSVLTLVDCMGQWSLNTVTL